VAGIEIEFGVVDAASPVIQRLSKELLEAAKSSGRFASDVAAASGKADEALSRIPSKAKAAGSSMGALAQAGASLKSEIAGLASVAAVTAFFKGSVEAIAEEERALFRLTQALRLNGEASTANITNLKAFASGLQATTGVADEQVIGLLALARTYSTSVEGAKRLAEVSIDLAAAMGTEPVDALRSLAGAQAGMVRELAKLNPEIKNLTTEQLKAGFATELVAQKVQGTAVALHQTFSGALADAKNQLGEFQEEIGAGLIPALQPLIANLRKVWETFRLLGTFIAAFGAQLVADVELHFTQAQAIIKGTVEFIALTVRGKFDEATAAAQQAMSGMSNATREHADKTVVIWSEFASDVAGIQEKSAAAQVSAAESTAQKVNFIDEKMLEKFKKNREERERSMQSASDRVAALEIEALQLSGQGLEAEKLRIQTEKEERLKALNEIAAVTPQIEAKINEARVLTMQNAALAEQAALEQFDVSGKAITALGEQVTGSITSAFGDAFADMIFEGKDLEQSLSNSFRQIAKRAVASLIEIAIQAAITQAIVAAVGGGAGAGAGGGGGGGGFISKIIGGLQTGGIVDRPTVARLAEAGEPEVVAPVSRLMTMIKGAVGGGGVGGGVAVTVHQQNNFTSPQGFSDEQVAQVMRRIAAFTRNGAAEGGELVKSILARQGKVEGQSV